MTVRIRTSLSLPAMAGEAVGTNLTIARRKALAGASGWVLIDLTRCAQLMQV